MDQIKDERGARCEASSLTTDAESRIMSELQEALDKIRFLEGEMHKMKKKEGRRDGSSTKPLDSSSLDVTRYTANDTGKEQLHNESLMTGTWERTASLSHNVKEYDTVATFKNPNGTLNENDEDISFAGDEEYGDITSITSQGGDSDREIGGKTSLKNSRNINNKNDSAGVSKDELDSVIATIDELRSLVTESIQGGTSNRSSLFNSNQEQDSSNGIRLMSGSLFGNPTIIVGSDLETSLDEDTFSLMMVSRVGSVPWRLGLASFTFQMTLGIMIAQSQAGADNIYSIPFKTSGLSFRVAQILTIFLCVSTQSDILTSIRSLFLLGRGSNWQQILCEEETNSRNTWIVRVGIPNVMKLSQGIVVTYVSMIIILQNNEVIDLLKDFTSLMVISEFDNVLFQLALNGYLGEELREETAKIADITVTTGTSIVRGRRKNLGLFFVRLTFGLLLTAMFSGWLTVVVLQKNGYIFDQEFPGCGKEHYQTASKVFGDGICFGGPFNTIECKFEGGDCANFNTAFPNCKGPGLDTLVHVEEQLTDNTIPCNMTFAIRQCDFDGGVCCPYDIQRDSIFSDEQCHGGKIGTKGCGYDGGDCLDFISEYPTCNIEDGTNRTILGNGVCEGGGYTTRRCGYEFGDCDVGQLGGDIKFEGVLSNENEMFFQLGMSSDASKILIGMMDTNKNGAYDRAAPGEVVGYAYDSTNFSWVDTSWLESINVGAAKTESNLNFGTSVGTNYDGSVVAVGSSGADSSTGRVEIYGPLSRGFPYILDGFEKMSLFGFKLDMTDDGLRLAVSSPDKNKAGTSSGSASIIAAGMVQVFHFNQLQESWELVGGSIYGEQENDIIGGMSLRINSADGNRVFFSAHYDLEDVSVRAYEFDRGLNQWIQLGHEIPSPNPGIDPLAISANGHRFAISSNSLSTTIPADVKIFDWDTILPGESAWIQVGPTIFKDMIHEGRGRFSMNESIGTGFGYSISMSADGNSLAVASVKPTCDGATVHETFLSLANSSELCATGSVQMYQYKSTHPSYPRFALLPLKRDSNYRSILEESNQIDKENILGLQLVLSGDGSKLAISGFDLNGKNGFAKVYRVSDLFYVNCSVDYPRWIVDLECVPWEPYYTAKCGFGGGLCPLPSKVDGFDGCRVALPNKINNTYCDDYMPNNSKRCGYDGGDCIIPSPVDGYPNCVVSDPEKIGNGKCDDMSPYNGYDCGFDGGDCSIEPS